jgi:hypothetical protein
VLLVLLVFLLVLVLQQFLQHKEITVATVEPMLAVEEVVQVR